MRSERLAVKAQLKSGMINYDMLFSLLTGSRDIIAGSKNRKVKAAAEAIQFRGGKGT